MILHYVEIGEGPLVVLLHGFPEYWYAWRRQLGALADAGFRVVAPDQRGYNLSDKPEAVAAYGVARLVEDVAALIRERGADKAFVVGHDWGAGVAWSFAMRHPEMVERLAVLNGPHPERLVHALKTNPVQLIRSWYMFLFQLPALPEALARLDGFAFLLKPLREEPARPDAFTREDLARYREAFAKPGALTAMIDWYRAIVRGKGVEMQRTDVPALVVWGEKDRHLDRSIATPSKELVPNARVVFLPESTHWVQHDGAERVNEELIAFFVKASA
ncbi:MAG: putative hydrolase [Labilithrix sp.]|nr:putative hydrolase [Labilithrix sp.]